MAPSNPLPTPEDYKSIAAQYTRAKALKEMEDREARKMALMARLPPSEEDKLKAELASRKMRIFKRAWIWSTAFFTWLLFIHATGIYLFTKGFLLTRLVLDEKSSCVQPPIELQPSFTGAGTPESGCWHPKTFDKAVIIIIDALRYDFTVPFNSNSQFAAPQVFHNALPFMYETSINEPQNAFLLPFIADPPTATMQRLKGLTTGTLPTFIDIGSNFAGTAIEEDNLLSQLRDAGRRIVHLGDDTWTSLFPGYFEEDLSHAYDSFNVWDLHTVDNGVQEHIIPLLAPAKRGEWDVMFAHYLGVDHAGHRYGPDHPAMTAKLQQMDLALREIVAALSDDTLLVVMGDHGMDSKGDHGGESDDEVEAALWMYSKKGVFGRTEKSHVTPPNSAKERPVPQIDLVPTLALLLGLPIPFNNLGSPISEAFIGSTGSGWQNLAAVARMTAAAVRRYQAAYYAARGIQANFAPDSPNAKWNEALQLDVKKVSGSSLKSTYEAFALYQRTTLDVCKGLWARFDLPSMFQGIAILAGGVIVLILYSKNVADDEDAVSDPELDRVERQLEMENIAKGKNEEVVEFDFTESTVTGGLIGTFAGASLGITASFMDPEGSLLNEGLLAAAGCGLFGAFASQIGSVRSYGNPLPKTLWGWLSIIFVVSQSIGFASNSYTIWEDSILLFFLSTLGVLTAIASLRLKSTPDRTLCVYHSVLFIFLGWGSSFSRLCREEQMPYCRSTYYASTTSSTSAPWQLLIPFFVTAFIPSVIKSYYTMTRSYEGFAPIWVNIAFRSGLLSAAIFWILDAADDGDWFPVVPKGLLKSTRVVIAQTVLTTAIAAGTMAFAYATPCVSIQTSKPIRASQRSIVTILGYANVHGTRYLLLPLNLLIAILMLTKPMGWLSLSLCLLQILSLLEILNRLSLNTSSIGPTALALLASFHFFKTGHTATVSSIQWESAFVPLYTIRYPWSPLLITLNTFGTHILCAACVPLIVLWKLPAKQNPKQLVERLGKAWATFLLYFVVEGLATTMWAAHLRRHLMLYRIFCPRFMMGAVLVLVVDLVGILVIGSATWGNERMIGRVFGWA